MTIERFEDIKAWQEARVLMKMIYGAVKSDKSLNKNSKFSAQIQSAMVSIMSNIAEWFSRRTAKEFIQFLFIAKGSTAEVQSQLYVALDQGYIGQQKFEELYSKSDEVARLTSGFIRYLINKDKRNRHNELSNQRNSKN